MKLSKQWFTDNSACFAGMDWINKQYENETEIEHTEIINRLLPFNFSWASWTICKLLSTENRIKYAVYAAKQILHIYEKQYPNDDRPRKAINAAENYLNNPCEENRIAAGYAANVAYATANAAAVTTAAVTAAAYAAYATAYAAAYATAYAADAAAYANAYANAAAAAYAAAYATYAATYATDAAAYANDANAEIKNKIINYGLSLIQEV